MRELFAFFVKNSKWLLFIVYVVISCMLLFQHNPYQHHLYLTSASAVASGVYGVSNSVYSYFNLRQVNDDLNSRNAELQEQVLALRQQLVQAQERAIADTIQLPDSLKNYSFVVAHVISNSISKPFNYITLNKGSLDGVHPEMGVIDQNGVVGIVNVVGPHSCRVISLLNSNLHISCRIKGDPAFGSLVWDGEDHSTALVQELPKHTKFEAGDTVVTSGYSGVFPGGIPVGIVLDDNDHRSENFFTLRVRLTTDFATLSTVQIVQDKMRQEHALLEQSDFTTDKTSGL